MKSPVVVYVGWFLILSAFCFYSYGLVEAIILSWSTSVPVDYTKYPETLSVTMSSIQTLLLTNLGVVLGISIAKPNSAMARQIMLNRSSTTTEAEKDIPDPLSLKDKIQLFALVIYIISLTACLVTWIVNKFSSQPSDIVSIIAESGKMFIGVVLAYLTAVLGRQ
jgi:hypothetical protein